jgi:hypothetical protein
MVGSGSKYSILIGLILLVLAFADISMLHLDIFEYVAAAGVFILMMGIGLLIRGY